MKLYCVKEDLNQHHVYGNKIVFGLIETQKHMDEFNESIKMFCPLGYGTAVDERRSRFTLWLMASSEPDDISIYTEESDKEPQYISDLHGLRECNAKEVEAFKQALKDRVEESLERSAELNAILKRIS